MSNIKLNFFMEIQSVKKQKGRKRILIFSGRSLLLRLFLMLLLCVGSVFLGYAQNTKTVTGKVSDANGEPIIGASVAIAGTTNGTVTDVNGNFTLEAPDKSTLVISYLGFKTQRIPANSGSLTGIKLEEDTQKLDEVVVVGFGTQKRANLTGSIAAINNQELEVTKNQNTQNMLTGKVPGVRVIQRTSEPGDFSNQFDIRGFGTPLIVIDGVPRGNDSFARLSPDEIESISVLKDASAAVYGVKAANGVVLVTTKKGESGKVKISYSGYYGIQSPADLLKPVGSVDRMTLFNEKSMRSTTNPMLTYTQDQINAFLNGDKVSTDWYGATLNNTAGQQQHTLSASGGTDKIDYFLNFTYTQQDGFFKSGDLNYDRYNIRANINAQLTNRFKVSLKLNGILDNKLSPNDAIWDIYKELWRIVPDTPVYSNNNPDYFQEPSTGSDVNNTVALTNTDVSGYVKNVNKYYQATGSFAYDVPYIKGLSFNGMFTYDNTINDNSTYQKAYNEYDYNAVTDQYVPITKRSPTTLNRKYINSETRLWQLSLEYNRSFLNKHNVSALLLFEDSHSQQDNIHATRNFSIEVPTPYLYAGDATNQIGTADVGNISEYASKSTVGKLNYDFEGKYIAEFSFRYDGSSEFPPSKRYGFFPGGSVGWRISEESFIKDHLSFIQNLKLRASYGKLGDDGAMDYQFVTGYDYPNTSGTSNGYNGYPTGYMFNGSYTNGLGFRAVPNPNITWQTSKTLNLGLDADLWRGLFGFSFDVFQRNRDGLLDYPISSLPGTFGASMPQMNINSDRTKGLELELRHHNRIGKDFNYSITGNMALTRTEWVYKESAPYGSSYDQWRNSLNNRWNDIWFGLGADGRYTSYQQIATSPVFTGTGTLPGDYIYQDWNGDGVIDDADRHPIATTTGSSSANFQDKRNYPLMNFGLTLAAQYKGFDLNVLFQGSAMSYIAYGEQLASPLNWNGNALSLFMDRWHPVDPTLDPYNPSNTWIPGYYSYGGTMPDANSSFLIQNGAYLRMKSAELGYTIPPRSLKKVGVQKLRVYVNGYNFLTFTHVKGVDPERPVDQYGYTYPLNRTVNFGLNIDF